MTEEATAHQADGDANTRRGAASSAAEFVRLSAFLVFNVAAFLLIIRYLPKEEMGWYALVNVVVNLGYVLADLQMEKVAVRRMTQGEPVEQVVGAAVGVRLAGSVIALVATQLLFVAMGLARGEVRADVQLAALLASSQFFGESIFVLGSAFQAQLRAYLDIAPRIAFAVLRFGFTLLLLAAGAPWWALFGAWVLAYAVGDAIALVIFRLRSGARFRPHLRGTARLVREALTLGVAGLLGMATVQWGTIYLGVTADPTDVAVFNTAILPIQYLSLFASVIAVVAFPLVSAAWSRRDRDGFGRVDSTARTAMLALFLPVTVLLYQVPLVDVMESVFGEGYGEAAEPLRLMSIALILASMTVWAGFVFLSIGHVRAIVAVNAACLTIGVLVSPMVVPNHGLAGLGAVGIAATGVGLILATLLLSRLAPSRFDIAGIARTLGAGAALWLVLELVGRWNDSALLLAAIAALTYPLFIVGARVFNPDVLADLRAGTHLDDSQPPNLSSGVTQ